ncbi:MAG: glycosyltransferase family 4 protein [Bacteroidetes bacterium]|nr:glycosyltransferase family 4 protein [Bacteroidota bacterium]
MKLLFTSYAGVPSFADPVQWLQRIEGYTGILESLVPCHEVISIERINYEGEILHKGVRYYFIRQLQQTKRFPFQIHRLIKKLSPDVVFINGFIFPFQLIQLRMMAGRNTRIVIINQAEKPSTGYRKRLQQWADRYVDAYLFTSAAFGQEWVDKGIIREPKKISEIFHGSSVFQHGDQALARQALQLPDKPIYLWVGRLDANKDPVTAVTAFIQYLAKGHDALLCMIFHEPELLPVLEQMVSENPTAAGKIRFVGKQPHAALENWYRAADFFISASHFEGGGISVCEAMSCGVIPLVTDIDPFCVLTGSGEVGILFKPGDPNSLLNALVKSDLLNRKAEKEKVMKRFQEHFSFTAIAAKINAMLHGFE